VKIQRNQNPLKAFIPAMQLKPFILFPALKALVFVLQKMQKSLFPLLFVLVLCNCKAKREKKFARFYSKKNFCCVKP
jgi:hypothetical protein